MNAYVKGNQYIYRDQVMFNGGVYVCLVPGKAETVRPETRVGHGDAAQGARWQFLGECPVGGGEIPGVLPGMVACGLGGIGGPGCEGDLSGSEGVKPTLQVGGAGGGVGGGVMRGWVPPVPPGGKTLLPPGTGTLLFGLYQIYRTMTDTPRGWDEWLEEAAQIEEEMGH